MGSQNHHLPFHAEVRGLSSGRVLTRVIDLNSALQGYCNNIFTLRNKTDAFKKKLLVWNSHVQKGDIDMFPRLQDFVTSGSVNKQRVICYNKSTKS